MKRNLLIISNLFFVLLLSTNVLLAQQRTVTGQVTSQDDGSALPGVNVVIKGTNTGTVTDVDGNYRLEVQSGDVILVFSSIGFTPQELTLGARSVVNLDLAPDVTLLGEVVITGLGGDIDKRRLSTTINQISSQDLESTPIVRIDQLLQSKLPNTQILQSTGAPGGTSIIRGRGVNSALLGQQPVIYIDGVRVDNLNTAGGLSVATGGAQSSALADIPVDQISDVTFLKGGAATTLYGSDAANGVLLITTNKGKAGAARVTFEAQLGAIEGTGDYFVYDEVKELGFRPGFLGSYRVGVNGGSDRVTYNFFSRFRQDNSFQFGQGENRYTIGGGYNASISDKLNYQGSFSYNSNNFNRLPNANSSFDRTFGIDQGLPAGQLGLTTNNPTEWTTADKDIVSTLIKDVARLADITERVSRFTNSHRFSLQATEEFSVDLTLGLDYRFSRAEDVQTNEYLVVQGSVAPGTTTQGSIDRVDRSFLSTTGTASFKYDFDAGDFNFVTIAGGQFFRNTDNQTQIQTTNQAETSTTVNIAADASVTDFQSNVVNYGFFFQEDIGYQDKVFLNFGFRNDYNTAFGSDASSEFYPKVGLAYVISEEAFWGGLGNVISTLKLRGSYGEAGNFPPPFTRDAQLNANPFLGQLAFQPGQPGDPGLGPEKLKTLEFGADFGFLNDKINLEVTYYKSTTENALFTAPFAPSLGQENQVRNIGEIENKGIEISSRFHIIDKEEWQLSVNASANFQDNEVTDAGGSPEFNIGGFTFLGPFVKEGEQVGFLRGNNPVFDAEGNLVDVDNNATVGNPIPESFGSFGLNLSYKNITLYAAADYQTGAQGVNTDEVLRFFRGLDDDRIPENSAGESFFNLAGIWVEDTDFLKVRNITVSYDIPGGILDNIGFIKKASISATALNPFNFHSSLFDPEVTGAGARGTLPGTNTTTQNNVTVGAFGFGTVSAPRQFIGTIRVNF